MHTCKYRCIWLLVGMLLGGCSGGGTTAGGRTMQSVGAAPATPTQTATPVPTVTPTPRATIQPTITPSATPQPTVVPQVDPTSTPSPAPAPTTPPAPTAATLVYVFPVQGTSINYGKEHHDYPATDIFCPIGSAFVAPTSGVVDFVSYDDVWDAATNNAADRGGRSIAIIGDDGVRYYGSHLSQIAAGIQPGVRVAAGELLGKTGKSGNAADTPPHLHFGISHPTTPDDWQTRRGEISPYPYLQAWARGENRTPVIR